MTEVLITSKTHMGAGSACVGGIVLSTGEPVRLLNPGGYGQYANTDFTVGDVWNIEFTKSTSIVAPHYEDVIVSSVPARTLVRRGESVPTIIKAKGFKIYNGTPRNIFDRKHITWAGSGSGYLKDKADLPTSSVGFWISDKDLKYEDKHYIYPKNGVFTREMRLKYVGYQDPIDVIKAGTLIRFSFAKWWQPSADAPEMCFLQLSGWY